MTDPTVESLEGVEPADEAMMRTYDPSPILALAARRGITDGALAARLGIHRTTVTGWRHRGRRLSEERADAAAVAVGVMPGELWPEWWQA